jgi:hypothetical protein
VSTFVSRVQGPTHWSIGPVQRDGHRAGAPIRSPHLQRCVRFPRVRASWLLGVGGSARGGGAERDEEGEGAGKQGYGSCVYVWWYASRYGAIRWAAWLSRVGR